MADGQPTTIFDVLAKVDQILAGVQAADAQLPQLQAVAQNQADLIGQILRQGNQQDVDIATLGTEIQTGIQILEAILAGMATAQFQAQINTLLQQILIALKSGGGPFSGFQGVRITLGRATDFIGGVMANQQLPNNVVRAENILVEDAAGDAVPAPSGDTFTVVNNTPTLWNVVIGPNPSPDPALAGKTALIMNALVQAATGANAASCVVSDSSGLQKFTETMDIVNNLAPTQISVDPSAPFDTPQPVPTTAGPG